VISENSKISQERGGAGKGRVGENLEKRPTERIPLTLSGVECFQQGGCVAKEGRSMGKFGVTAGPKTI